MNIEKLTESQAYQAWVHSQLEPEEHLFIGWPPSRKLPTWMLKGAEFERLAAMGVGPLPKPVMDEDYLRKHGIE